MYKSVHQESIKIHIKFPFYQPVQLACEIPAVRIRKRTECILLCQRTENENYTSKTDVAQYKWLGLGISIPLSGERIREPHTHSAIN